MTRKYVIAKGKEMKAAMVEMMLAMNIDTASHCGLSKAQNKTVKFLNECYAAGNPRFITVVWKYVEDYPSKVEDATDATWANLVSDIFGWN